MKYTKKLDIAKRMVEHKLKFLKLRFMWLKLNII